MTNIDFFKMQAKNLFEDYKNKGKRTTLMKMQHEVAVLAGFKNWGELIKAPEGKLESAAKRFVDQSADSRGEYLERICSDEGYVVEWLSDGRVAVFTKPDRDADIYDVESAIKFVEEQIKKIPTENNLGNRTSYIDFFKMRAEKHLEWYREKYKNPNITLESMQDEIARLSGLGKWDYLINASENELSAGKKHLEEPPSYDNVKHKFKKGQSVWINDNGTHTDVKILEITWLPSYGVRPPEPCYKIRLGGKAIVFPENAVHETRGQLESWIETTLREDAPKPRYSGTPESNAEFTVTCPHCEEETKIRQTIWKHHLWMFWGDCDRCRKSLCTDKEKKDIVESDGPGKEIKYSVREMADLRHKYLPKLQRLKKIKTSLGNAILWPDAKLGGNLRNVESIDGIDYAIFETVLDGVNIEKVAVPLEKWNKERALVGAKKVTVDNWNTSE